MIKTILSFGGGTQSTAMVVLVAQGKIPPPDLILFCDTGFEKSSTMKYYNSNTKSLVEKLNIPFEIISRATSTLDKKYCKPYRKDKKITDVYYPSIPLYQIYTGAESRNTVGKSIAACSSQWKRDVAQNYLISRFPECKEFHQMIGFSIDEMKRARRAIQSKKWKKIFPLINLRIDRFHAIKIVSDFGLPRPPRSSCYMCPNMQNGEWQEMRDKNPHDWEQAINFEKKLKAKIDNDYESFLHRSCKPLQDVNFDAPEQPVFGCDTGECFT